jgi:hypothetical protein
MKQKFLFATLVFVSAAIVIVVATFLLGMNVPAPDAPDAYIPTQNAPTSGMCMRWDIPGIQIGTQAVCLVP